MAFTNSAVKSVSLKGEGDGRTFSSIKFGCLPKKINGKLQQQNCEKMKSDQVYCKRCEATIAAYYANNSMGEHTSLYQPVSTLLDENSTFNFPYCIGCDLKYPAFLPGASVKDYKRLHEIVLKIPRQYLENLPRCTKTGSQYCEIYQIKGNHSASQRLFMIVQNLISLTFEEVYFGSNYHVDNQLFISVKQDRIGSRDYQILGYCVAGLQMTFFDVPEFMEEGYYEASLPDDKIQIKFVWVHRPYRRQKVASSLVDAARNHFFDVFATPKENVRLWGTTDDGVAFSTSYLANCNKGKFRKR